MSRIKKFQLSLLVLLISVFCFNFAVSVSANEMKPIKKFEVKSQETQTENQKQIKKLGPSDSANETVTEEAKNIESKGLKRIEPRTEEIYAPGDVIVLYKNSSAVNTLKDSDAVFSLERETQQVHALAKSLQARVLKTYPELSNNSKKVFALVHSDSKSATELLEELKKDPNVLGASLNHRVYLDATPNDTYYSELWGMKAIKADKVWDNGNTGNNTTYTAVIDTGITTNHVDLQANIDTTYSRNFSNSSGIDDKDGDKDGHGSHVAGTIAAVGNNSKGVVGVNWTSKIIALRVFNDRGICYNDWVIDAVNYLCNLLDQNPSMNIAAVNMSLGHFSSTTPSQHKANNDPFMWHYQH